MKSWWKRKSFWKKVGKYGGYAAFGVCVFASAGACIAAGVAVAGARAYGQHGCIRSCKRKFGKSFGWGAAWAIAGGGVGGGVSRIYRSFGVGKYTRTWRAHVKVRKWRPRGVHRRKFRPHWTHYKAQVGLGVAGWAGSSHHQNRGMW